MNQFEEAYQKQQKQREESIRRAAQAPAGYDTCGQAMGNSIPRTIADEKAYEANRCFDQGKRATEAADFLRAHPEFERFIALVRSGAIQF